MELEDGVECLELSADAVVVMDLLWVQYLTTNVDWLTVAVHQTQCVASDNRGAHVQLHVQFSKPLEGRGALHRVLSHRGDANATATGDDLRVRPLFDVILGIHANLHESSAELGILEERYLFRVALKDGVLLSQLFSKFRGVTISHHPGVCALDQCVVLG